MYILIYIYILNLFYIYNNLFKNYMYKCINVYITMYIKVYIAIYAYIYNIYKIFYKIYHII